MATEANDIKKQKILRRGGKNTQKNYLKKIFMTQITMMVCSLTQSQTSWNAKWALGTITTNKASGGDRIPVELFQILKDDAVKMPANLENSAVATGLEKFSFHLNSKERQCQRKLKLPQNCTYLICQQSNAQNFPSQASIVCELWTSRCPSWFQKRQRNQKLNCQHPLDH